MSGPSGFALEFNGIDTYVEVADSPSLDIVNQLTIEAWIYIHDVEPTPDWRTIIAKTTPSYDDAYGFLTHSDQSTVSFYIQHGGVTFITLDIQKNKWVHIVGTVTVEPEAPYMCFYVDGVLRGAGAVGPSPIEISDLPLVIGGGTGSSSYAPYFFKGILDDIRIYNRVLTPTEVQEHYNGIFNDETGLAALWYLDEGSGTETADSSGNENNGILINNPQWVETGAPPTPSELCTWIEDRGGPSGLTIIDVFTIADAWLLNTPPVGYTFIPTIQNVFGVADYWLGFNGDPLTGCNFWRLRVENLTFPAEIDPNTPFDVEYDSHNIGSTDMMWGHLMDRSTGIEVPSSRWEEEIIADGTKHVITHFDGISVSFNGRVEVGHIPIGMNMTKRYVVDHVIDIGIGGKKYGYKSP